MRKLAGTIAALGAANEASKIATAPANNVIAGAKSQMVAKYGVGAYVRPKMWYLSLLKLSLSQPMVIAIVFVVGLFVLWLWLFGWVSLEYMLYALRCQISVIVNTVLVVVNAVWFAFHALTRVVLYAFLDLINAVFAYFISPIANMLATLIGVLDPILPGDSTDWILNVPYLGQGMTIDPTPSDGVAYLLPTAAGFKFVKPGADIYVTDANGQIEYEVSYTDQGVTLEFPIINEDAVTQDFWCKIDKPPDDIPYEPAKYFTIHATTLGTVFNQIVNIIWGIVNGVLGWWANLFNMPDPGWGGGGAGGR